MIILASVSLLLPGLAWWAWLGRRRADPLVSLAQVVGISLAGIILLALAGFILGFTFSPALITIILVGFVLLTVGGLLKNGFRLQRRHWPQLIIGLLLLSLAIAWRLYQARDLLLPNWVDSQHHFLIIQAILENGGIPQDLMPSLPVPFYYHFGYHVVAALFTAISRRPIGEAMLVLGQVLNALVGLSVYALGKALWRNWRPALAAALLVSFATRMPAYYLSWGRYTLTVGLILLPLAMGLALEMLRGKTHWRNGVVLGLLTAALLLTHYFAALLLAAFIGLLMVAHLAQGRRRLPQTLLRLGWMVNSAIMGLLLALPWLLRLARYAPNSAGIETNLPESVGVILASERWQYIWQLLGPTSNRWLLVPAGIGLIVALIKRHNPGFALWSLALALMSLPWGLTLPPFRPDHFAIVLFLPVSLLVGYLTWLATRWLGRLIKLPWVTSVLIVLVVLGWTAWGFPQMRDIVNPDTVLVTAADLDALDWVAENTPAEARFYINTAYWLANAYRGVDGGGWLLPYAGRWALVPTVFYGFSPDTAWAGELRGWGEAASQITGCTAEFWALIEAAEVDWLYLRTGVGSLQPESLVQCEGLKLAFKNDSVYVYQLITP